ncbi:hypothetical protein V1287_003157 [Bradyrhizobium sp. AZCC 1699]
MILLYAFQQADDCIRLREVGNVPRVSFVRPFDMGLLGGRVYPSHAGRQQLLGGGAREEGVSVAFLRSYEHDATGLVKNVGDEIADRRSHSVLLVQNLPALYAVGRNECALELAPLDIGDLSLRKLPAQFPCDDIVDHRLELKVVADQQYPAAQLERNREFARRTACRLIDNDPIKVRLIYANACLPQADARAGYDSFRLCEKLLEISRAGRQCLRPFLCERKQTPHVRCVRFRNSARGAT